jgi:DNA-binding SARP family transcriptional activator
MAIDLAEGPQAVAHAESLIELALAHGFHSNLLTAYVQRLNAELLDQRRVPSLDLFIEVPGEAFGAPSSVACFDFEISFGIRALCLGLHTLAHSLFSHLVSSARGATLTQRIAIARFWLMHVQAYQGNLEAARTSLAEIGALSAQRRFLAKLWPSWALLMLQTGHLEAAQEAFCKVEPGALSEGDRLRVRLYRLVADVLADEAEAAPRLQSMLEGPDGLKLQRLEARVLRRVGASDALPPLCLKLLGQPCLQVGEDEIEFPRRKVLSLLALLALHPGGVSSEELTASLFPRTEDVEPEAALRKAVYLARRMLKAAGMPDPIEHAKGGYRLRHERFDLIDCRELELLHLKACECEAQGYLQGARFFHQFVVWMGTSLPFEGLPEPCFVDPRARLVAMYERSRTFLLENEVPTSLPALAWSDAWASLDKEDPALARRIRAVQKAWMNGDDDQARASYDALLIETSLRDRPARIARGIFLVQACMMVLAREAPDTPRWIERLMDHASRHPGEVDHLMVHGMRLHWRILDEGERHALPSLLEVPSEWLTSADPTSLGIYLAAFVHHFARAGHPLLASQITAHLRQRFPSPILETALALGVSTRSALRPHAGGMGKVPLVLLKGFGEPEVVIAGGAIRFPRKKCLALIALLALHPQGLDVEAIFSMLYPETRHSNAKKTIYTLVATTRQALDAGGASDLIVSLPGFYRLRGERIGHCDQQAFDALYAKASELEHPGGGAVASDFYRMAASLAEGGPLYEGLDEPCFEELRRSRQAQAVHAKSKG